MSAATSGSEGEQAQQGLCAYRWICGGVGVNYHSLADFRTEHEAWLDAQPTLRDLRRLTAQERALYDDLRWLRLHERPLRLEQERIAFGTVVQAVASASL